MNKASMTWALLSFCIWVGLGIAVGAGLAVWRTAPARWQLLSTKLAPQRLLQSRLRVDEIHALVEWAVNIRSPKHAQEVTHIFAAVRFWRQKIILKPSVPQPPISAAA